MATLFYQYFSLFIFTSSLISSAQRVDFRIPDFNLGVTSLFYRGDTSFIIPLEAVQFNNISRQVGQVLYARPIALWDSQSGSLADFSTHFSFVLDTWGAQAPNYGHGFAFLLAPVVFQQPVNSDAGYLGLFNSSNSGSSRNQVVSVEFDSFLDEWDPDYEHVGININSIASSKTERWNATSQRSNVADAWIVYNSSTKNLTVYWSYGSNLNSSLSYVVDLREILPELILVGFSASTGDKVENHQLYSWEFTSNLDRTRTRARKWSTGLIVGLGVSVLVLGGLVLLSVILLRTHRKRSIKNREIAAGLSSSGEDDLGSGAGLKRFCYNHLISATNNFSFERKLGEGSSGEVYKGDLVDANIFVAVKKFSKGSNQLKKQYMNELKIISSLRHRNLVQLIGWCSDHGEFLLVYEYMPNGSLNSHIFGKKKNPAALSWGFRYKIALGLASGLLYLHEEWEQCVIHRDIKSSNIMLDSNFNAKLGDFGLAKFMDHELGPQTTGLAGTLGYLAPEYISTGRASKESDVYSFGIVALEIVTGRKSMDPMPKNDGSETGLCDYVWDLYGTGKLASVVDEKLNGEIDVKQVECLLTVGLWCSHPNPSLRPSMRQAIQVLEFQAAFPKLPTKMPVLMYDTDTAPVFNSSPESLVSFNSANMGR